MARRTIPKTVKVETNRLAPEQVRVTEELLAPYTACRDHFYARFSGPKYMDMITDWTKVRDMVRREQHDILNERKDKIPVNGKKTLCELFGFQGRHWVMALKDVCANINSGWSNLANECLSYIRDRDDLKEEVRSFCRYVFSVRTIWKDVLLKNQVSSDVTETYAQLKALLSDGELRYAFSLIHRITRKKQHARSVSGKGRCMLLDEAMYTVHPGSGHDTISVMGLKQGERISYQLKGKYCYCRTGNIQLVYDKEKKVVRFHKLIEAKTRDFGSIRPFRNVKVPEGTGSILLPQEEKGPDMSKVPAKCRPKKHRKNRLGVDKGFSTLLSCSTGREYGFGYGIYQAAEADWINDKNTKRNLYYDKVRSLEAMEKSAREELARKVSSPERKAELGRLASWCRRKAGQIKQNNLGRRKYDRHHGRKMAQMESMINHSVNEMLEKERPKKLGKEDLTFQKEKGRNGPGFNRKMSSWTKGTLDERMEYKCLQYNVTSETVSAAYTSQTCCICGAKITERTGAHHEIAHCPNCGKLNAITNAGLNIENRIGDEETGRYVSYKKIRETLIARYQQTIKAAAGKGIILAACEW